MSGETRRSWARRLAPFLLLALALILFRVVAPSFPRDHDVLYVLGDEAPRVIRLDVAWRRADRTQEEPSVSASWHFSPGKAPRRLSSTVRLPNGSWEVSALIEKVDHGTEERLRRVELEAGTTIVRLE